MMHSKIKIIIYKIKIINKTSICNFNFKVMTTLYQIGTQATCMLQAERPVRNYWSEFRERAVRF